MSRKFGLDHAVRARLFQQAPALLFFIAGLLIGHQLARAPRPFHARDASLSSQTAHWNFVAMYRGGPRNPRLDARVASQCGQDLTIAEIFKGKREGYFVDMAANDAFDISNSLTLERKYGWRGLCVEPNPVYAKGYLQRVCQLVQAVVGPRDGVKIDFNFHNGAFGGVVGFDNKQATNQTDSHFTVSIRTLLRDFNVPRIIDYLSLDIEGAEAWAFETFPWDNYRFLVLTVERPKPALRGMLEKHGYAYLCDHGSWGDEMWVHTTLPDFEAIRRKYGAQKQCRMPVQPGC